MSKRISTKSSLVIICVLAVTVLFRTSAAADGVVDALEKKYIVTLTTPDREQITKQGSVMSMKTAGVYTLATDKYMYPDNKVIDGKVSAPSMVMRVTWTKVGGSHVLQAGEKVVITKVETRSDSSGDFLRLSLLTVDPPSGEAKKFDGIVSFKFKKGYLDEAPPEEVENTVEAVLAPDTGGDQQQPGQATGPPPPPVPPTAVPGPRMIAAPPPPPPAAAPATVTIGESSTQVLQAMGMPTQMIDLGKKKTYIYKDMKIIFINDKVSDVQ